MLARKSALDGYRHWNERWGAPYGRELGDSTILQRLNQRNATRFGPFAFQIANHTRAYEYAWAYEALRTDVGMRVLDVGGGLSGLQFVLCLEGCEVTNVDPEARQTERTWSRKSSFGVPLTPEHHQRLNDIFDTDVRLVAKRVQDLDEPDGSYDRVVCLSVLEHVPADEARSMLQAMSRLLAPGGRCVLTIDLFLDVVPFGVLDRNTWGTNLDLHRLLDGLDLRLEVGEPSELHGFPQFTVARVAELVPDLVMGHFSALTQSLVLVKPA